MKRNLKDKMVGFFQDNFYEILQRCTISRAKIPLYLPFLVIIIQMKKNWYNRINKHSQLSDCVFDGCASQACVSCPFCLFPPEKNH